MIWFPFSPFISSCHFLSMPPPRWFMCKPTILTLHPPLCQRVRALHSLCRNLFHHIYKLFITEHATGDTATPRTFCLVSSLLRCTCFQNSVKAPDPRELKHTKCPGELTIDHTGPYKVSCRCELCGSSLVSLCFLELTASTGSGGRVPWRIDRCWTRDERGEAERSRRDSRALIKMDR